MIGPAESLRDHPGFDKVVVLAVSPQWLDGTLIGYGGTPRVCSTCRGRLTRNRCNDYIAAVVRTVIPTGSSGSGR